MTLKQYTLNLFTLLLIPILPHLGYLPNFSYSIPILLLVFLSLKYSKESLADIGLRLKSFPLKSIWIGSIAALLILGFMQLVFHPVLQSLVEFQEVEEISLYTFVKANPIQLIIMIIMGWIIGGFYEEMVFHGFIFTRLEKMIPSKHNTNIAFLLAVVIFGFYHIQLGTLGMINALVVGIVYLGLYIYYDRNLWYSIICHGVYNSIVMVLIYFELL